MFGCAERKLLLQAYKQPIGAWVHVGDPAHDRRDTLHRAAKALERVGLIDRANIEVPFAFPRRPRAHLRLTALGRAFCATFTTQLATGGRISLRLLEQKTGYSIPSRRKGLPPWLTTNPPRVCNRHPA